MTIENDKQKDEIEEWIYEIDTALDLLFKNKERIREYIDNNGFSEYKHDEVSFRCLEAVLNKLKSYGIVK